MRETREIYSMVDKLDPAGGGERSEVVAVRCRAGHEPRAGGELLAVFPFGNGPDVLRVGGTAPWQVPEHRRVASHRGRRVQEVRMQPIDIVRHLRREDQRLTEAANAVRRYIAREVAQPLLTRLAIR